MRNRGSVGYSVKRMLDLSEVQNPKRFLLFVVGLVFGLLTLGIAFSGRLSCLVWNKGTFCFRDVLGFSGLFMLLMTAITLGARFRPTTVLCLCKGSDLVDPISWLAPDLSSFKFFRFSALKIFQVSCSIWIDANQACISSFWLSNSYSTSSVSYQLVEIYS